MRASWALLIAALVVGVPIGLGAYTFVYARGAAYLVDDPAACANCHVMREQYDGWHKSSHRAVATCNDCHTPAGFVPKYLVKAENGFRHSLAFTTGWFPEHIRITDADRRVTEGACRKCHTPITEAIEGHPSAEPLACTRCHDDVGHLH